jgi:formic-like protein
MTIDKVVAALNSLDLKQMSLENVEILQKMLPTEQEVYFANSFHISS